MPYNFLERYTPNDREEIEISKRCAIGRAKVSAPVREMIARYNMAKHLRVLHLGCGRATLDTAALEVAKSGTLPVFCFDPNYARAPEAMNNRYSLVVCSYVLNVLPPSPRMKCVEDIRAVLDVNGTALIAVRSAKDRSIVGVPEFDGVRTSTGTFQKGYTVNAFADELATCFRDVAIASCGDFLMAACG